MARTLIKREKRVYVEKGFLKIEVLIKNEINLCIMEKKIMKN